MNEQWFLLGDIHGSAQPIYYFYQKNKDRLSLDSAENYMILLGDVGAKKYCSFASTQCYC